MNKELAILPDLSPKERKLVYLILETGFIKTKGWYAKKIGVGRNMIYKYLAKPGVMEALNKVLDDTVWTLRPLAYDTLVKAMKGGSVQAAKLVLQLSGELVEHKEINIKELRLTGTFDPTRYLELLAEVAEIRKEKGTMDLAGSFKKLEEEIG